MQTINSWFIRRGTETTRNNMQQGVYKRTQHVTPNIVGSVWPTMLQCWELLANNVAMLGLVGQQCCVRLHRALKGAPWDNFHY